MKRCLTSSRKCDRAFLAKRMMQFITFQHVIILLWDFQVKTTNAGLDRETTAAYTLVITARDDVAGASSEQSASADVIITITDVNDNSPLCTPTDYQV